MIATQYKQCKVSTVKIMFIYNDHKNIEKHKWKYKPENKKLRFKPIVFNNNIQ